jgi:RNA polymerase sigma-70 factor, ECF subfamily
MGVVRHCGWSVDMGEDAELWRRLVAGESAAAGELYDRYAPLIRAVAFDACHSLVEADDLVQQVFLHALSRIRQLRKPDRLGAWLVGIARHEGRNFRREAAIRRARFPAGEDRALIESLSDSQVQTASFVREAVSRLPDRERMAIHIHYLSGESADAARQILGLSKSGFYKLLERARKQLHQQLLQYEERR